MSVSQPEVLAPMLGVQRNVLAGMLREHGEEDLAGRALSFSNDEMARIGTLGAYYAFSEDAIALGGSMGGSRALAMATVDVLDDAGRPLHRDGTFAADADRDRELRRHFAKRQIPADPSKRILNILDPPAWGPPQPDASLELQRCHALRSKPLENFSPADLRFMIDQQVSLNRLVGLAVRRLRIDPLIRDRVPGDLLISVLSVDASFWEPQFDLEVEARRIAEDVRDWPGLEPGLRQLVAKFVRDHPPRSADHTPD